MENKNQEAKSTKIRVGILFKVYIQDELLAILFRLSDDNAAN